jgi:MtN3 and saliva related transmembrane protein
MNAGRNQADRNLRRVTEMNAMTGSIAHLLASQYQVMSDWIGYAAAVLTTAAFLPQVIKTVRSQETKDISVVMYLMLCAGIVLWLVYGLMIQAPPVILANLVTLIFAGAILALKLKNG